MQLHKQIFNRRSISCTGNNFGHYTEIKLFIHSPIRFIGSHDFRQTQTASSVWLYHKFGFNPFVYHVPMFGGKYWILEFPLYQIVTYAISLISGVNDLNGKIVSILSYIISTVALYLISKIILNVLIHLFPNSSTIRGVHPSVGGASRRKAILGKGE